MDVMDVPPLSPMDSQRGFRKSSMDSFCDVVLSERRCGSALNCTTDSEGLGSCFSLQSASSGGGRGVVGALSPHRIPDFSCHEADGPTLLCCDELEHSLQLAVSLTTQFAPRDVLKLGRPHDCRIGSGQQGDVWALGSHACVKSAKQRANPDALWPELELLAYVALEKPDGQHVIKPLGYMCRCSHGALPCTNACTHTHTGIRKHLDTRWCCRARQ